MKKTLLCLLLILIIAFSFAACNVVGNEEPELGSTATGSGVVNSRETGNGEQELGSNASKSEYVAPDLGEKGYAEYLYEAYCMKENEAPRESLITSVAELNRFSEQLQVIETFPNEGECRQISNKLNSYSSEYFEENALIIIFRSASSGSYWYTVENVETDGSTANVTLQYWQTSMGTCDMKYWTIIIECPKGTLDSLNVVTQTKEVED